VIQGAQVFIANDDSSDDERRKPLLGRQIVAPALIDEDCTSLTRLLLGSPAGADTAMGGLIEHLEFVLSLLNYPIEFSRIELIVNPSSMREPQQVQVSLLAIQSLPGNSRGTRRAYFFL
jgi:hypothetical protein